MKNKREFIDVIKHFDDFANLNYFRSKIRRINTKIQN